MKVKFYGTRGSIPVPEKDFMEFGGNTACILLTFDSGDRVVLDAGSGIRKLGKELAASPASQQRLSIALSHTHWDHIQGFPFFGPAYLPGQQFTVFLCNRSKYEQSLEHILSNQMRFEYFPVSLEAMKADIRFWEPSAEHYLTEWGAKVTVVPHPHPGEAYGYRFEYNDKVVVYCTDVEHAHGIDPGVVKLSKDADLLIHDAQYTPEELESHHGWGHSSWEQAIEVAELAGAKKLALFHHDPDHNDAFLRKVEKQCQQRFPDSFMAREGMEVEC